jgi:phage FluMu protein Com
MSEEIVRCPYCVTDSEFRPMLPRTTKKGFFCRGCGHLAMPDDPYLKCSCSRCRDINRIAIRCRSSEGVRRRETMDIPVRL